VLIVNVIVLSICGGAPAEEPYVRLSQIASAYYFAHFLIILPLLSFIEKPLPLPNSIAEAVLGKKADHTGSATGLPGGAAAAPAE
jgi:ubiquinol-cytochrome c reductase cytochrome b subunit